MGKSIAAHEFCNCLYSAAFKSKLVLEVLQNEKPLSEIARTHNVTPKNLQNWKKTILDNAEIAMEPSKAVKEYKIELAASQEKNEMLTKIVGKITIEKEWLEKPTVGALGEAQSVSESILMSIIRWLKYKKPMNTYHESMLSQKQLKIAA